MVIKIFHNGSLMNIVNEVELLSKGDSSYKQEKMQIVEYLKQHKVFIHKHPETNGIFTYLKVRE